MADMEDGTAQYAGDSLGMNPKTKPSSQDWQPGEGTAAGTSPGAT